MKAPDLGDILKQAACLQQQMMVRIRIIHFFFLIRCGGEVFFCFFFT